MNTEIATMTVMALKQFGGPENFALESIPRPEAGTGEILIRVKAIGINPIDIKTRQGGGQALALSGEEPMILGWDVSGEVVEAGFGVKDFKEGDEVFGTVNFPGAGKTYAEYVAVPAGQLAEKPTNIPHAQAAAATLSALTAWQALVDNGCIRKGQKVLIHGGAGGVGNYAVQIAKHFGCYVIATAAGTDVDFVKSLGADEVIDYRTERFEDQVKDVDFILDTVGGENFVRSLKVLKPQGTIILLPSNKKEEAGRIAKQQNIRNYKHILVHSSGEDMRQIAGMLAEGSLKAQVDRTYPFEQIPQAHRRLEEGKVRGKIVVALE